MKMFNRALLAFGVLGVDLIFFFVPLTAIFLAYIIMVNPAWFRTFLDRLDVTIE